MVHFKHIITTICLIWVAGFVANGQSRQERFEAIENQKAAYITKHLQLTPSEAQRFFPLYNQYIKEIRGIKSKKTSLKSGPAGTRSFQSEPTDVIKYDAQEVNTKKKYRTKFADVIGKSRSSQFFAVEQEFIELLYKELRGRKQ